MCTYVVVVAVSNLLLHWFHFRSTQFRYPFKKWMNVPFEFEFNSLTTSTTNLSGFNQTKWLQIWLTDFRIFCLFTQLVKVSFVNTSHRVLWYNYCDRHLWHFKGKLIEWLSDQIMSYTSLEIAYFFSFFQCSWCFFLFIRLSGVQNWWWYRGNG